MVMTTSLQISNSLFQDLRSLIIEARQDVARQVNSALVMLYWRVGQRIRKDILKEERADYGERIVSTLSTQLVSEFGLSFSSRNLWHMLRFAEGIPGREDCERTEYTIGLDPFPAPYPFGWSTEARLLCGNVPHRTVEHSDSREEDLRHAVRANRPF